MIYGIVIDGRYNSIKLGEVRKVEFISETSVQLENTDRYYMPRVCAYVDEDGKPLTIRDAIKEMGTPKYVKSKGSQIQLSFLVTFYQKIVQGKDS